MPSKNPNRDPFQHISPVVRSTITALHLHGDELRRHYPHVPIDAATTIGAYERVAFGISALVRQCSLCAVRLSPVTIACYDDSVALDVVCPRCSIAAHHDFDGIHSAPLQALAHDVETRHGGCLRLEYVRMCDGWCWQMQPPTPAFLAVVAEFADLEQLGLPSQKRSAA